jgi:ATP-dependent phosphofructokinase / diphosphate-dependent phosphofructokinase
MDIFDKLEYYYNKYILFDYLQVMTLKHKPRIGIINGGGDCPGLNTVIDSLVKSLYPEYELFGFYRGYEGLLEKHYFHLFPELTNRYKFQGGTILKSVNYGNFPGKIGAGQTNLIEPSILSKTKENYKSLELDGIVVLGGDGTMSVALQLQDIGLNIIGVPKSIDNDLFGTDFTFGFQTAVEIAAESLDRLETTGYSHDRVMVLEVMGRNAGWIGLHSGIAGGANMILIPEIPFTYSQILKYINTRREKGKKNALIVVAEGASAQCQNQHLSTIGGQSSEQNLTGIGSEIAKFLNQNNIDTRATVLGHIQRGGSPNSFDRILSRQYGAFAGHLVKESKYGQIAVYNNHNFDSISISQCVSQLKLVDPDSTIITLSRQMGISFGQVDEIYF